MLNKKASVNEPASVLGELVAISEGPCELHVCIVVLSGSGRQLSFISSNHVQVKMWVVPHDRFAAGNKTCIEHNRAHERERPKCEPALMEAHV